MTEATALLRLQHGREDALAWFIDNYTGYVCTVIRYIIGASMTEEDVEEAASDVFLALWEQADCITLSTVRPWLGGVARNKARQKLRDRGLTLSLDEDLLVVNGADLEEDLAREERDRLFPCISEKYSIPMQPFSKNCDYRVTVVKRNPRRMQTL